MSGDAAHRSRPLSAVADLLVARQALRPGNLSVAQRKSGSLRSCVMWGFESLQGDVFKTIVVIWAVVFFVWAIVLLIDLVVMLH